MKAPYIIALVVVIAAAGIGVYLSRSDKTGPDNTVTQNSAAQKQSMDQLKNVDQLPASGDEDQIIDDVLRSFEDEAKIESEGDADVAVVSEGDSEINSLMGEYNENAF